MEDRTLLNVQFTIDPLQDVKPISRYIYGINQTLSGPLYSNFTYQRLGGDLTTDWNWVNGDTNAGKDFYFQNQSYSYFAGGGNGPGGAISPTLQSDYAQNAATLVTVPINGYVATNQADDAVLGNPVTTVTGPPISSTATVIPVANAAAIPSTPYYIVIDGEEMEVTSINLANNQLTVVRGTDFGPAATISANDPVYLSPDVRNAGTNYLETQFAQELPVKPGAPGSFTLTPDPSSQTVYADEFVNWVNTMFPYGETSANAPIWFSLDNEPDLWASTHAEIQPGGSTTLSADISSSATTIAVAEAYAIAPSNAYIASNPGVYTVWIDSEEMQVTAVDTTANTLTVVRGVGGTTATAHTALDSNGNPVPVSENPVTYAELLAKEIAYAQAIKSVEANALVFGAVNWGWPGYLNLQGAPDAAGRDWLDYYLQQMNQAATTYGQRLLDVLDVHFYTSTPDDAADRVQAPRSLWDPTYVENSYVSQSVPGPIELLPRLQAKIAQFYPGTKLSISEYNYGGPNDISGAIAEADALGIFGEQGVYAASEWQLSSSEPFIASGFNMYRNFDGSNSTFGDTSVLASTNDVTDSSIYASVDSSNANDMTLVAINKSTQPLTATIQLDHVQPGATAAIYQLTSAAATPQYAGTVTITDPAHFTYMMPGSSVTTIRIISPGGQGNAPTVATPAQASASPVTGTQTNLSVLGADAGGAGNLTYTWATTGTPPAPVTFSDNGDNTAQNTTATFSAAGSYSLLVTIANAGGYSATSSVSVTVDQTLTDITVTPFDPTTPVSGQQQFVAAGTDQFGNALVTPPSCFWSAGAGSITSTGLFTAPAGAGDTTITAAADGVQGSTTDFVISQATITVSTPSDTALGTAIASANADAAAGQSVTVDFAASLAGDTITLSQGPLELKAGTGAITIDGGGFITLSGADNSRVFQVDSGAQATFYGLTIEDGSAAGSGGGIDNAGMLIINNCTLTGDSSGASGGGIDNAGSLTVTNTTLSNNTADANGGAIENSGSLTMTSCTISGNSVGHTSYHPTGVNAVGAGGGIDNSGGTLTLNNITVSGNVAGANGGGICNNGGTLTLTNASVFNNSAGNGGGIVNDSGLATVVNSTIADNSGSYIAGGINNVGTMTVTNSTFAGNFAYLGGGIYNGNYYGGSGNLTLSNDTLTSNFAAYGGGGGIYMANGSYSTTGASTLALFNILVAGNFASGNNNDPLSNPVLPFGPDIQVNSGTVSGSYNLIGDGQGLTGISNGDANDNLVGTSDAPIDALLAAPVANVNPAQTSTSPLVAFNRAAIPLAKNGGPTSTIVLSNASPAEGASGAVTTVTGPIFDGVGTIPVADAAAIASTPGQYFILIDGEEMEVTNVNLTNNELSVVRGINGVTAALHGNDPVYFYADQRGFARATPSVIGAFQPGGTPTTVPAVTSVSPSFAATAGNTQVIIEGVNLAGTTAIHFGMQAGTILSVSANEILAQCPPNDAGTVDVTVSTANTTSALSPADQFTYESMPAVTGISPATGLIGGGTGVVITGTSLLGATAIAFGGNPGVIFSASVNQIVAISPAGATAGPVDVTVTTPLGTSPKTPADQFTYNAATSTIYVTTTSDSLTHTGISLRDAVAQADADAGQGLSDTILFSSNLSGDTITLAQGATGLLTLTGQAGGGTGTIIIDGGNDITVSGGGTSGVFQIDAGAQAVLAGLTVLDGNAGTGNGGAVNNAGTLTVLDDTLSNNSAANGGAICNSGTLTLVNSTLAGNSAAAGGAIDNVMGGIMTVSASALSGNTGSYVGGAINNEAAMTVTNSTLANNNAYLGGAINNGNQYGNGGTLTLTANTINGNTVTGSGGGIYMENGGNDPKASTLTLADTIVAKNGADGSGPDIYVSSGSLAGIYNLIGIGTGLSGLSNNTHGNQVGTSASPLDPKLAALANNGGFTQTMSLQTGSPATGRAGPVTTLAASISSTATAIPVADAAAIGSTPGQYFIKVGSEEMEVTDVNVAYGYLTVMRGINGAAASHQQNSAIYLSNDQRGGARPGVADIGAFQSKATIATMATITAIGPAAGPAGGNTVVAITGVDLAGVSAVHIGTKEATVLSVSANLVLAISPAAAPATADITVTTAAGTSATSPADRFTYQGAPTVTGISPAIGLTGGGTGILITGTNLLNATAVEFGANPGVIIIDSANEIVAASPAATGHGTVAVTVTTLSGISKTSSAGRFTYAASASTLTVTTKSDALIHSGVSLRDAVSQANVDAAKGISDTIVFASSLSGATITLGPRLQDTLELSGAGAGTVKINGGGHITVSGSNVAGVFQIDSGVHAFLTGLTIVDGNAVGGNGGAISNAGTLTLLNDKLSSNTAANGGAIANTGTLTLMSSTLAGNSAAAGGAIWNVSAGVMTVTGCTLAGNTGSYIGGAIDNEAAMTVTNSTLANNSAYLGGAVNNGNQYGSGGTLTLTADTISGNSVTGNGGGICTQTGGYDPKPSTLTLLNTIVAKNTADQAGPDIYVSSGTLGGSDNFIGSGAGLSGISNGAGGNQVGNAGNPLDPKLAVLANNGGPTQTMALQSGSQAIAAAGPVTALAAAVISAKATTIALADATVVARSSPPAAAGYAIVIDGEMMLVTAVAGNMLTVVRDYHGTKAATHAGGANVFLGADQRGLIAPTLIPDIGAFQTPTHLRIIMNPAAQIVNAGQKATFSASAVGVNSNVQWQVSSNGGTSWSNIPGATAKTVAVVNGLSTTTATLTRTATAANNGFRYRVVFMTSADKTDSLAAQLTVT